MGTQCTLAFGKLCGAKPSSFFFSKENYGFYFFSVKLAGVFEGAHRILFVGIREGHYVDVCSGELRRMIIESDDKS